MMRIRFNGGVLAVSLLTNVALLGGLVWLNRRPQGPEAQPVAVAPAVVESAPPFRWSQLESSDYRTYIANLRKVGCPELTIREIVAADVADLFAPQRGPLLAKMSGAGTPAERSQAEAGLRELGRQEAAIIRKLFGLPNPVEPAQPPPVEVAVSPAPARNLRPADEDTTAAMPLVFQDVDPKALKLNEEDQQTINEVRQMFLAELGSNQDVSSPEYLHRWQRAQKQADSLLDGLMGRQFTLKYEEAAENLSAANAPLSPGNRP